MAASNLGKLVKPKFILVLTLALFAGLHPAAAQVAFAPATNYSVGVFSIWVAAADVNGDGKMDLVSANSGTNTLSVLTNKGSGSFASAVAYIVGNDPRSVVAVDVNGDGWVDLVSANAGFFPNSTNTLTVLTNN